MFHLLDRGGLSVQPTGSAGKRHVFVAVAFEDGSTARQIEFVLSERAAHRLGQALMSGSVGVMQELNLADPLE
jgi:hypothetical protein